MYTRDNVIDQSQYISFIVFMKASLSNETEGGKMTFDTSSRQNVDLAKSKLEVYARCKNILVE